MRIGLFCACIDPHLIPVGGVAEILPSVGFTVWFCLRGRTYLFRRTYTELLRSICVCVCVGV